jgi:tRNA 2-thiouridine synthesizing protein C
MLSTINVIVRKAPGEEQAVLGLRTAWAMINSGGFDVQLIYMGDGVYNLLGVSGYIGTLLGQVAKESGMLFAHAGSLRERGIAEDALVPGIELLEDEDLAEKVADADATTTY